MPKSQKRVTKAPKDPYRVRPCRLCKAKFKPTTHVVSCADAQEFCCPNHRKEYWKYGGLPFDKMMARIEKRCREICREEMNVSLDAALARLRESPLVHENLQKMIRDAVTTEQTLKEIRRDFPSGVS
jgi:hypothetical protein